MKRLFQIPIRSFLAHTTGKVRFQRFFRLLHDISIRGMNYGSGFHGTSGELLVSKLLENLPTDKVIILDIGANTGDYANQLSERLSKPHQFHCFEPSSPTYKSLKNKTSENPNIQVYQMGMGEEESEMTLYSDKANSVLSSLYKRDLQAISTNLDLSEKVLISTVDNFCDSHKISRVDFLKIDVEGHEIKVLEGALRTIADSVSIVQFEFGEACIDSKTFLRDFYRMLSGFEFFRIVTDGFESMGAYNPQNEIFRTVNILAIRSDLVSRIVQ